MKRLLVLLLLVAGCRTWDVNAFGVPVGIELGNRFGWHMPLVALVVVGLPVLPLAVVARTCQ